LILIVQPAVPTYRVPLYLKIVESIPEFCAVEIVCEYACTSSLRSNLNIVPGYKMIYLFMGFYWQSKVISRVIQCTKGDLVIFNGNLRLLNIVPLLLICRIRGIRTIWWGHLRSAGGSRIVSRLRPLFMRLANHIAFYTAKECRNFLTKYDMDKNRVTALQNACCPRPNDYPEIYNYRRQSWVSPLRVLFLGRLTQKADFPLLVEALGLYKSEISLDVIGGVSTDFLSPIPSNVHIEFHGYIENYNEVIEVSKACNVFVYPGAVGLSCAYALFLGLPIIIHGDRECHMPEADYMEDRKNGLVFDKGSSVSLINQLNRLDQDRLLMEKLSQAAIAAANEEVNLSVFASNYLSAISKTKEKKCL
jgi:glycosyltransferase involved in cell wall biosynthesis